MTDILTLLTNLLGEMPYGLEFLLPVFGFCLVIIGLVLIATLLFAFMNVLRG